MASTEPTAVSAVDPQQIVATIRSGSVPANWSVWRLQHDYVRRAALEWAASSAFGFVLLVPIALTTVPYNFQHGAVSVILTSIMLAALGALAFGSLWLLVIDLRRLARADQYLLVFTPDDYLKLEPGQTTHVPMKYVSNVTLKGVSSLADEELALRNQSAAPSPLYGTLSLGRFMGGGSRMKRRELRRPPSLAFLDLRTERTVVVGTDDSLGELSVLEHALATRARG